MHLPRQVGPTEKRLKCKNTHPEYANQRPKGDIAKPKNATNAKHVRGACFRIWFEFLGFVIRPSGHCFATNPIGFRIGPERWRDVVPYLVQGISAPLWLCGHQQLTASDRSGMGSTGPNHSTLAFEHHGLQGGFCRLEHRHRDTDPKIGPGG